MKTGSRGDYSWLTTAEHELHDLITTCLQAVLGKYIAVTSWDSGSLVPNEDEILAGWQSRGGIAYSPKVESVEKLPHDLYDEWYVFKIPRDLGKLFQRNVFETSMQAGQNGLRQLRAGVQFEEFRSKGSNRFISVAARANSARSFVSDGDLLNFATTDDQLFDSVRAALKWRPRRA